MWKNIVARGRSQMTVWRMRIACWIPKATNTHVQVVQYLLFFHFNNVCTNAPQCSLIPTSPILSSALCDVTADVAFYISGIIVNL